LRSALFKSFAGLIRSPIILAIIAGFTFAIFKLKPPDAVTQATDMLALASGSVALFVIGGTLVGLKIKGMIRDMVQIVASKLLLHPLAVFGALMLFPALDPKLRIAAVTLACVPMLSIYPIFGQRYGEEDLCAAALMAATVASFLTISAVLGALHAVGFFAAIG
jgi:predicted permease